MGWESVAIACISARFITHNRVTCTVVKCSFFSIAYAPVDTAEPGKEGRIWTVLHNAVSQVHAGKHLFAPSQWMIMPVLGRGEGYGKCD